MSAAVPQPLPDRLAAIIDGLRRKLAFRAAKDRAFAPLLLILWNRLSRTIARFAAIAARQQAGTLRKPKPRSPKPAPVSRPGPPRDPLPRRRGWLLRQAREAGPYGEYLRLLLEEPEMAALIEAAPQLRRILRPLWRMLRREPPPQSLREPPPASPRPRRRTIRRRPPPAAPRAPAPRKPRASPILPGYTLKRA